MTANPFQAEGRKKKLLWFQLPSAGTGGFLQGSLFPTHYIQYTGKGMLFETFITPPSKMLETQT